MTPEDDKLSPPERTLKMKPHAHVSPTHALALLAFVVLALGTIHLLALTTDNRASRAFVSLGF